MSMDGSPKVLVIKYFLKRIGDFKRKVKDLKPFSSKEVSGYRIITLNSISQFCMHIPFREKF